MFLLIALVGILSILLLVTASVAYLALPSRTALPPLWGDDQPRDPPETSESTIAMGSMAVVPPLHVGGSETPRCRPGSLDPPVDHDSGFRWGDPDYENVPIFYWRSDDPGENGKPRPDHMSGFKWQADEEPTGPTEPDPPGFSFPPSWELKPPHFPRRPGVRRGPGPRADQQGPTPRPWYLSWLISKIHQAFTGRSAGTKASWNRRGPEGSDGLR